MEPQARATPSLPDLQIVRNLVVSPGVDNFALWAPDGALMTIQTNTLRRREKMFGEGRSLPLDRNAKARIMTLARALTHRSEKGRHYGELTAKFVLVLEALLWGFHNAKSGRCFPSYERIAERAHCARATVYAAIHALEASGILTWCNRIVRIREWGADLFGRAWNRWRVIRTSNAYVFRDPQPAPPAPISSKSKFQTGTTDQELNLLLSTPLNEALKKLGTEVKRSFEVGVASSVPTGREA